MARFDGEMCERADSAIEQFGGACVGHQHPANGRSQLRIVSGLVADQLIARVGRGLEQPLEDLHGPLPAGRIERQAMVGQRTSVSA